MDKRRRAARSERSIQTQTTREGIRREDCLEAHEKGHLHLNAVRHAQFLEIIYKFYKVNVTIN